MKTTNTTKLHRQHADAKVGESSTLLAAVKPFPLATTDERGRGWKLHHQELAYISTIHEGECNEQISEEDIEWIILYLQSAGYMIKVDESSMSDDEVKMELKKRGLDPDKTYKNVMAIISKHIDRVGEDSPATP